MSDTVIAIVFTFHLFIALSSVVYTAYAYTVPSAGRLRKTYALMAATLGVGTYLVWNTHVRLTIVTLAGAAYMAAILYFAIAAQRKLAYAPASTELEA